MPIQQPESPPKPQATEPQVAPQTPVPSASAAPATEPAPASQTTERDFLVKQLFSDMGVEPAPQQSDPASEPEPAPATSPAKPSPKKKEVVVMPKVEAAEPAQVQPSPSQPATPASPVSEPTKLKLDEEYIAGLEEEQKMELEEAAWAESNLKDRYKGMRSKLVDWYKRFDKKIAELKEQDPGRKLDEMGPDGLPVATEIRELLSSKPQYSKPDFRAIQRGMAEEAAIAKLKSVQDKEFDSVKLKQRELELGPVLKEAVNIFESHARNLISKDESPEAVPLNSALKRLTEDEAAAAVEFPSEVQHIKGSIAEHTRYANKFLRWVNQLDKIDENKPDPDHLFLINFIRQKCDQVAASQHTKLTDGRTFATWDEWNELHAKDPKQLQKRWTLGNQDVLDLLAINAKEGAKSAIQREEEWAKARGYERKPTQKLPPQQSSVEPSAGLKATPSRVPGSADTEEPTATNGLDVIKLLGLRTQ